MYRANFLKQTIQRSSVVERSAVNRLVVGSNPTAGAIRRDVPGLHIAESRRPLYIGMSEDVRQRLEQHNSQRSKWTKSRGPWRIVWQSAPLLYSEARKLENKLKRQKRGDGFYKITGLPRSAVNPAAAGS